VLEIWLREKRGQEYSNIFTVGGNIKHLSNDSAKPVSLGWVEVGVLKATQNLHQLCKEVGQRKIHGQFRSTDCVYV